MMGKESFMKNRPWNKPELVVLARSNPDEGVLTFCKNIVPYDSGPNSAAASCALIGCGSDCNIQAGS